MYVGYCDVEISYNIKRLLTESGVFIDVGGGIGYFTAIASEIVGSSGQVHCFEPYPAHIEAIRKTIQSKPNSNIMLNPFALGVDDGVHPYYTKRRENAATSSMVEHFYNKGIIPEIIYVKTQRLDRYLEQKKIKKISLIKIDVDGYEYFVLKGLEGYFEGNANRPPIIVEITPYVCSRLGYTMDDFRNYMLDYGYQAYNIFNPNRKDDIRLTTREDESRDVIFIADR